MKAAGRRGGRVAVVALWLAATCPIARSESVPDGLPQLFDVEQLGFRLSYQNGNAAYAPRTISLISAGVGRLESAGKQWTFRFAATQRVALLNALIDIHFFDLPSLYSSHAVARLADDGTVSMIGVFRSDAQYQSVCVSVAAFEKCVRYGLDAPPGLDRLARGLFDDVERWTGGR